MSESSALAGETIEVWRLDLRIIPRPKGVVGLIVREDEQNVWLLGCVERGESAGQQGGHETDPKSFTDGRRVHGMTLANVWMDCSWKVWLSAYSLSPKAESDE